MWDAPVYSEQPGAVPGLHAWQPWNCSSVNPYPRWKCHCPLTGSQLEKLIPGLLPTSEPQQWYLWSHELLLLSRETVLPNAFSSEEMDYLLNLGRHIIELEWQILYAVLNFCPGICPTVLYHVSLFPELLAVSQGRKVPFLLGSYLLKKCWLPRLWHIGNSISYILQ